MRTALPKITTMAVIAVLTGGVVSAWLFLRNQPASVPNSKTTEAVTKQESLNPENHNYIDTDFAKRMIVHNQQGIQMAEIAQKNTDDESIRQLAATISDALSSSTKQYIEWLTDWDEEYFNLSFFPEAEGHDSYPTHPGMASLTDLRSLESATGSSVDQQFLRLMIAHHEGAAEMARLTPTDRMQFGEMIRLKNNAVKNQEKQIEMMKQLQTK